MKRIALLFIPLLLWAACKKEPVAGPDNQQAVGFSLTRYGDPDPAEVGRTYRFMVYSADSLKYLYTGTYVRSATPVDGDVLAPCGVDNNGALTNAYDASQGVHLQNGGYSISMVSPAVSFLAGTWNTFTISRFQPFLSSDPQPVAINGYGVYLMKNPLVDRRIRLTTIHFLRGDDLTADFTLGDLTIANAGQTGRYHANNLKIEPNGPDPVIKLHAADPAERADFSAANPGFDGKATLYYTCNTRAGMADQVFDDGLMPVYLLHSTFGEQEVNPLALRVDMTRKVGGVDKVYQLRLPLLSENFNFQPSKTYRLNITIKTLVITATVEIFGNSAWQTDGQMGWENIGNPTETITLGSWNINDWETGVAPGGPEIIG